MKHCLILVFLTTSLHIYAQASIPDSLAISIEERLKSGHSPSYAIGIIDKDGPQYFLFGKTHQEGNSVDQHTIYEIGSITKTFTALLLAQSVIDGEINLTDPIQKYLPEGILAPTRNNDEITLGQLSDHTSGFPRMPTNFEPEDPQNPFADYTIQQLYDFITSHDLIRDIGSAYEYSNVAQGLLGHILELRYKESFEQLVIEKICLPLGMLHTKITLDDNMKENLALGHNFGVEVPNWDIPTLAGAGALRSSLHDMLIFISANLGLINTNMREAMDLTHTIRHDKAGGSRVGLGWHITTGAEGDVIWHNGGTGGYRTFAGFVKESGKGVVVLTNSTKGADDIGLYLLDSSSKLINTKREKRSLFRKKK